MTKTQAPATTVIRDDLIALMKSQVVVRYRVHTNLGVAVSLEAEVFTAVPDSPSIQRYSFECRFHTRQKTSPSCITVNHKVYDDDPVTGLDLILAGWKLKRPEWFSSDSFVGTFAWTQSPTMFDKTDHAHAFLRRHPHSMLVGGLTLSNLTTLLAKYTDIAELGSTLADEQRALELLHHRFSAFVTRTVVEMATTL